MTSLPDDTAKTNAVDQEWAEIQAGFDPSFWASPNSVNDLQRGLLLREYRERIDRYLGQGNVVEKAKGRALEAITKVWGISLVADNSDLPALLPLPPEKTYAGKEINGSFAWIREQADNALRAYLIGKGGRKAKLGLPPYRLVAAQGSLAAYRSGRAAPYDIYYRDDRGLVQYAAGLGFVPDYEAAKAKADVEAKSAS